MKKDIDWGSVLPISIALKIDQAVDFRKIFGSK